MAEKLTLKRDLNLDPKQIITNDKSDPVFLSLKLRNEYIGSILGFVKMLSKNARVELAELILSKQDIISISSTRSEQRNDTQTKKRDKYILNQINPLLDRLDTLGLDFLRIHIRDMVFNLGDELREKMLFKRFEHRLVEKFNTFKEKLSHSFNNVSIEIEEFLEKNEIHLYLKSYDASLSSDMTDNKHIVLNTKNKVATISHFDQSQNQVKQTYHSLDDNNFLYHIYDIIWEMENRLNPSANSQVSV